ncbi:MAG: class I SAM-dependent methyltransferase [Thermotaleaceae bacterium]
MIGIKEKSKAAFNQQALTYDNNIKGQHARNLYPVLLEKLSGITYNTFLDLGCGTGAVIKAILDMGSNKKAYGIDLSENMLQVAKEKLEDRATLTLGDAENLPYGDSFFDVVYCNDSFHHYPAPDKVVAEVHRVLKPGGTFIIGDCWQPLLTRGIMNAFMKWSNEGDVKMYSEKQIRALLSICFQNITWTKVNQTSFLTTATK